MTKESNPYFEVFAKGMFQAMDIVSEIVPSSRRMPNDLQSELDERWKNYNGIKWPNDEKVSRFRYEGYEVVGGDITLRVSPSISYKDCISWEYNLANRYGRESAPLPLMVTSLIETNDCKIIISRRNDSSDYKAGGLSGVGGAITIKDDLGLGGSLDVLHALAREVEEETGIKTDEIKPVLQGVIHNPVSGTVNLTFIVNTGLSSVEIQRRIHDDENELLYVDINPSTIQNLVLTRTNSFTTEALELLISIGTQRFGNRWADSTREIFRLRWISYSEAIRRGPNVVQKLERKDIKKFEQLSVNASQNGISTN